MNAIAASLLILASVLAAHFANGASTPIDRPVLTLKKIGFRSATKWGLW
jgi:hypothetical protein